MTRCARFVIFVSIGAAVFGSTAVCAQGRSGSAKASSKALAVDSIDERARKLFEAGRAAYDIGDYSRALENFQQAYELSDRPQLLYNIGQCADRLRLDETALAAFRRYIQRVPDAANRYQVEERISVLQDVLSSKFDAGEARDDEAAQASAPSDDEQAVAASLKPTSNPQADGDPAIWSQWWFWAAAGGVVAITVVGIAIASSGDETKSGDRATGSDGRVIATLSWGGP